jgi:ketosteroid isomerase-like protein
MYSAGHPRVAWPRVVNVGFADGMPGVPGPSQIAAGRKRMRHVVGIAVVVMAAQMVTAPRADAGAALDSLVANERAFAAMAKAQGTKEAFLTYLAEDCIVFQPTATNGRKVWEARQPSKATLLWEPCFAEVSSAGDMGYTTGPWEWHPPADSSGTPAPPERYAYGHFSSVWKRQHGVWRVILDIGVTHPKPASGGAGSGEFAPGPVLPIRTMKSSRVNLAGLDRDLSKTMRAVGAHEALAQHAAADVRFNIEGQYPSLGIEATQARVDSVAGFFDFKTEGSGIASSGDLAYTYGLAERFVSANAAAADTSAYLHVWRQEDGRAWKLALAVLNPLGKQ